MLVQNLCHSIATWLLPEQSALSNSFVFLVWQYIPVSSFLEINIDFFFIEFHFQNFVFSFFDLFSQVDEPTTLTLVLRQNLKTNKTD